MNSKIIYKPIRKILNTIAKIRGNLHLKIARNPVSLSIKTITEYNNTRSANYYQKICHAPFTNLYFGYDGKIGVCCYNRTHLLGTYPETSIKDAWFGKSIVELREKINKYDLTSGCYPCKIQWEQKAYKTVLARNFDHFQISGKYPKLMEFELSNQCNLECIMCSEINSSQIAHKKFGNYEISITYDNTFIDELKEFIPHLQSAKFLGGEPFLIPIYYKIWDVFIEKNKNCELIIQTNGIILNNKIKELLSKANFSFSISLDTLEKENYERIRKNAKYDIFYNNLLFYIEFCKKNSRFIGISACFMQQNWMDIPNLMEFCNSHQIPITFNRVWTPSNCSVWASSLSLIQEITNLYQQCVFSNTTKVEQDNYMAFRDLINQLLSWKDEEQIKIENINKYLNIPNKILETMLYNQIIEFEESLNSSDENLAEIKSKLEFIFDKHRNQVFYKKILTKLMEIPVEIIHREFLQYSEDQIEQLIKDNIK